MPTEYVPFQLSQVLNCFNCSVGTMNVGISSNFHVLYMYCCKFESRKFLRSRFQTVLYIGNISKRFVELDDWRFYFRSNAKNKNWTRESLHFKNVCEMKCERGTESEGEKVKNNAQYQTLCQCRKIISIWVKNNESTNSKSKSSLWFLFSTDPMHGIACCLPVDFCIFSVLHASLLEANTNTFILIWQ